MRTPIRVETFECSCEHGRAGFPLIEAIRFAKSLRKLSQSSDLKKIVHFRVPMYSH